jgi:hypothetical protein
MLKLELEKLIEIRDNEPVTAYVPPDPVVPATDDDRNILSRSRVSSFVGVIHAEAKLPVVHLPFRRLDEAIGGLPLHSLTTFTAGSGKGKSSIAVQVAAHHAEKFGPCVYYVAEMTPALLAGRLIAQRTGRSWREAMRGEISEREMRRVLDPLPLFMVKRSPDPVAAITTVLDAIRRSGDKRTPMVVVDYAQLLADLGAKGDIRVATIAAIDKVKAFVEDRDVVGVMLSQASRTGAEQLRDGVKNAEDAMAAGGETAQLENASTNMLQISYASKDGVVEHDVQMLVAKSRFGGGTRLPFRYNGKTGLWSEGEKLVVTEVESDMDAAILRQIDGHAEFNCYAHGGGGCGEKLTQELLYDRRKVNVHRAGTQHPVRAAVKRLLAAGVIHYTAGELRRIVAVRSSP